MTSVWDSLLSYGEDYFGPERDYPLSSAERVWLEAWLFGIVVDDGSHVSLGSYWNPEGSLLVKPAYYVPDDHDTKIPTVSVDSPPTVDVAWDARPLS